MRRWGFMLGGLALCGAGLAAVNWAIYELVQTGTCASGGPYVSARPCPSGTGLRILALIGGILAGLVGVGVHAMRGAAPRRGPIGLGLAMWSLLFLSLAVTSLLAAFGPGAEDAPGSELGVAIMAAVFIPMGIAPLAFAFLTRDKGDEPSPIAPTHPGAPNVLAPTPVWPISPPDRGDER